MTGQLLGGSQTAGLSWPKLGLDIHGPGSFVPRPSLFIPTLPQGFTRELAFGTEPKLRNTLNKTHLLHELCPTLSILKLYYRVFQVTKLFLATDTATRTPAEAESRATSSRQRCALGSHPGGLCDRNLTLGFTQHLHTQLAHKSTCM